MFIFSPLLLFPHCIIRSLRVEQFLVPLGIRWLIRHKHCMLHSIRTYPIMVWTGSFYFSICHLNCKNFNPWARNIIGLFKCTLIKLLWTWCVEKEKITFSFLREKFHIIVDIFISALNFIWQNAIKVL